MRPLQVTLFLVALLVLSTQTFRHVYVKWIEPQGSALDAYREPVEQDIAASKDLHELLALYEEAHGEVKAFEASARPEERHEYEHHQDEPYATEQSLRSAIERWEAQSRSMFELWFYWLCGLLSIAVGVFAYLLINRWLGMVGIITGFTEMAFWTSPLWRSWGPQAQFDRLLTLKLVLSLVSWVLLVALWLASERSAARRALAGHKPSPTGA